MSICAWNNCEEEAITELQMDAGQETCPTCGNIKTNKTIYPLCQTHLDLYQENSDNHLVTVNATAEEE